jgi:type IV pilus assembly protein PilM
MTLAIRRLIDQVSPRLFGNVGFPIGLYLAGERLSAAQMQRTPAGPAVQAVSSLELGCPWYAMLGEPRRLKHALKEFWADHGFRGRDVVACMPHEQLKVFSVDYSATQGQTDAEAIANEVRDRLKGKARRMVVDFAPVRQPNQDERVKEAVVAAAAHEDVTAFLGLLEGAGLNVRALDISGMALRRIVPWVGKSSGEDMQNALLINIGAASSHLMVVWGRRLMVDRAIEFSEQRVFSRIAKLLDTPEHAAKRLLAEHGFAATGGNKPSQFHSVLREILGPELLGLKSEMNKTLDYAASKTRGNSVDRIFLVGGIAGYAGSAQFLGEALAKRVELLDPLAIFPHRLTARQVAELSPHCGVAVAIGLALRGLPEL